MPRPTKLKIGYITFTVEYLRDSVWLRKGLPPGDGGQTHGAAASIKVRDATDLDEIHVREVLLHEVLHACVYASGLALEGDPRALLDIEETFVSRTAPTLLDVLRVNPGLVEYLTETS